MKTFLELIKIKHWVKNFFFVFAPLVFSLSLFKIDRVLEAFFAFLSFSFVAVFVYIQNDIKDKEFDSKHPRKSKRPIASGKIKIPQAIGISLFFLFLSEVIAFFLGMYPLLIINFYLILNVVYTYFLKRIPILDVIIIAIGFCLRVFMGSAAIGVTLSHWMMLMTFSVSLILGFGKRRHELLLLGGDAQSHRFVLKGYNKQILDMMITISTAITALSYALYTMDGEVINRLGSDNLIFTIPFVIFGLFRYLLLVYKEGKGGSPEEHVVTDPGIVITVILWIGFIISIIYFDKPIHSIIKNLNAHFTLFLKSSFPFRG